MSRLISVTAFALLFYVLKYRYKKAEEAGANDLQKKITKILDPTYKIINTETGKTKDLSKNHKITIEEYFDDDIDSDQKFFMNDITFIKSFRGNGIMLNDKLTTNELAMAFFLTDFICYDDCVLRTNGNKKGKPLSIQDIAGYKNQQYDTVRKIMKSLKDKEIIDYHKVGTCNNDVAWITVNPFVFCRGCRIKKWIIEHYSDTYWAKVVREKMRDVDDYEES